MVLKCPNAGFDNKYYKHARWVNNKEYKIKNTIIVYEYFHLGTVEG